MKTIKEKAEVISAIAKKIIDLPDNDPADAVDYKLMETFRIVKYAMEMAERNAKSELIEQMHNPLMDAKLMLEHQKLDWTETYKEIKSVLANEPVENTDKILDGSLTGDDAMDVIVQQWLKLTEELFKKIK